MEVLNYLYYVTLPYACFGFETKSGVVIDAPPIAKWMIGKNIESIYKWIINKRGTIQLIEYT